MKKSLNTYLFIGAIASLILTQSCVETDELTTPNVASPVLILLDGSTFDADSPVTVNSRIFELDKTNILDHTNGIDSIPVPDISLSVFINNTNEVASLLTDIEGSAELVIEWSELGLDDPSSGSQIRLEFAGKHNEIPFRKYHTVRVK